MVGRNCTDFGFFFNRSTTQWNLDPRVDSVNIFDTAGTPKGIGNQVSIEFNLIYRWHATVSDKNAKWLEDFFDKVFPGIDPETMTQAEFMNGLKALGHGIDSDPGKWTFGGLNRTATGGFDDGSLVKLLTEETEDVAGAFGARNVSCTPWNQLGIFLTNLFSRFLPL